MFLDKEASERYEGSMGTWFNGDHRNMIDSTSYRAETVDVAFISRVVERSLNHTETVSRVQLNPALLKPFTEAANRLGVSIDVTLGGAEDPISIRSSDDSVYGLIMPMKREERGPSPLIDMLSGKEKATMAAA